MPDIVLLSDERIAAIPVRDCGEPLLDLRAAGDVEVDHRQADAAGAYAHVRAGTLGRLRIVQRSLPPDHQLVLIEGYRPPELQRRYFEEYRLKLAQLHPDWDPERLRRRASRYISPPDVAPHVTGGAVDVTMRGPDGRLCWMGTEVNASPEESDDACYTGAANISAGSRANREILGRAMALAGFVNYPTEWWHWSFGDRYWSFTTGAAAARYGPLPGVAG